MVKLIVELSGGLELLFGNVKHFDCDIPSPDSGLLTMRTIISWVKSNLLKERVELFASGDSL